MENENTFVFFEIVDNKTSIIFVKIFVLWEVKIKKNVRLKYIIIHKKNCLLNVNIYFDLGNFTASYFKEKVIQNSKLTR